MGRYSFGKSEKLCSESIISRLFAEGRSFKVFPLRVFVLSIDTAAANAQVLISVPKKRVRKAHDRNRIKRLVREVYRLNKPELIENWKKDNRHFAIGLVWLAEKQIPFAELNTVMREVIAQLESH